MRIHTILRLTSPLLVLTLAACATGPYSRSMERSQGVKHEAEQHLKQLQQREAPPPRDVVRIHKHDQWINPEPVQLRPEQKLEQLNCDIRFEPHVPVTLGAFAQIVNRTCHLPIRVTTDARRKLDGLDNDSHRSAGQAQAVATPSAGRLPPLPGLPLPGLPSGGQQTINLDYHGRLVGLLDRVAMQLGLSWKIDNGGVTYFYTESRIFTLYALPGKTTLTSSVESGTSTQVGITGAAGGAGGGSGSNSGVSGNSGTTQTTNVTLETDIREDLKKAIESMLTPDLGRMAFASSTGTITVTDRPAVLDMIGAFIADQNKVLTKQVVLNIRVMSVQLSDRDSFGIDWSMVYNSINGRNGVSLVNVMDANPGAVNTGISVLKGPFAGTKLLLHALSQQGAVSTITSPSVTTLNMQPAPVQVARQTGYLAEVSTNNVAQVGSSTSLTPGMVTDGFNMTLLPQVMGESGELLLQFSVNLSRLDNIRKATSGESAIEIPEVSNRAFSQRVKLHSGETLVLSGFQQLGSNATFTGAGSPRFWMFGGGRSRDDSRQILVVLITPVITG